MGPTFSDWRDSLSEELSEEPSVERPKTNSLPICNLYTKYIDIGGGGMPTAAMRIVLFVGILDSEVHTCVMLVDSQLKRLLEWCVSGYRSKFDANHRMKRCVSTPCISFHRDKSLDTHHIPPIMCIKTGF